jgi:hypothetical protein
MVDDVEKISCIFKIGDLVRLIEDKELNIGFGLIIDIKLSLEDVYDIKYFEEILEPNILKNSIDSIYTSDRDIFPQKPLLLVSWNKLSFNNKSMWMYSSELMLVNRAVNK